MDQDHPIKAKAREPRCARGRKYIFASKSTRYSDDKELPRLSEEERSRELSRVTEQLMHEREWLGRLSYAPFHDVSELMFAINHSVLLPLREEDCLPYRAFQQDKLQPFALDSLNEDTATVPYTRPGTLEVLELIGEKFQDKLQSNQEISAWMKRKGINRIRFTVSSITRTTTYQKHLVKNGALAAEPGSSAHNFGLAFDISNFGYYADVEFMEGVTRDSFTKAVPVNMCTNTQFYNEDIIDLLQSTLDEMDDEGYVHYINELPGACGSFHVVVRPA